jgi:hypothetical protein
LNGEVRVDDEAIVESELRSAREVDCEVLPAGVTAI